MMAGTRRGALAWLLLATLIGCAKEEKREGPPVPDYARPLPEGKLALVKITHPSRLPDFKPAFRRMTMLREAIDHSLNYFQHRSSKDYYPYLDITHDRAVATLRAFRELIGRAKSPPEFQEAIRAQYDVYQSVGWDGRGSVLFTGYCQPIYDARLKRDATYRYPLYKRPPDLVTDKLTGVCAGRRTHSGIVPYYTRKEIETQNLLAGQELVYLKGRLEAFIVHVQGSALLRLPDGSKYEIGYHGKTDRPYASIREALVRDGKIDANTASLTTIKAYFQAHPEDLDRYLHLNESYVFFMPRVGGPFGSLGVPVTPYHTLATDKKVYPRGCLAMVATELPSADAQGHVESLPFVNFMLDQDTGGYIRAAGKADIFLGTGERAELLAGHMRSEGKLYYIVLKAHLVDKYLAPATQPRPAAPGKPAAPPGGATTKPTGKRP